MQHDTSILDMPSQAAPTPLYPPLEPDREGLLEVGDWHRLYYAQAGTPGGIPAVVLHGGPGSGSSPAHLRFFDPARYHMTLFDQRGCGRSTPRGALHANTTAELVADIETLRAHLGLARWLVVGGSWGASLGIAYAAAHPASVAGLLLRGSFLTGPGDLDWFFRDAAVLAPAAHAALVDQLPLKARDDPVGWLAATLDRADAAAAWPLVRAWMNWERALDAPASATPEEAPAEARARLIAKYRLQAHYLARRCFLGEAALLDAAARLPDVPTLLLHGAEDRVCRPENAVRLHARIPAATLYLIPDAGHAPFAPAMAAAMRQALDRFAATGRF